MSEEELIIDESNFDQYFFNIKDHRPQRGQVIARYSAIAEFCAGPMKNQVIELIRDDIKAEAASRILRNVLCSVERDSFRIPREMAQDLLNGMTEEEVRQKPYRYTIEMFYYTEKNNVPIDDMHWSVISINNLDEFLDATGNKMKMASKLPD